MGEYIWYHWFGNFRIGILKNYGDFIERNKKINYFRIGRIDFWKNI